MPVQRRVNCKRVQATLGSCVPAGPGSCVGLAVPGAAAIHREHEGRARGARPRRDPSPARGRPRGARPRRDPSPARGRPRGARPRRDPSPARGRARSLLRSSLDTNRRPERVLRQPPSKPISGTPSRPGAQTPTTSGRGGSGRSRTRGLQAAIPAGPIPEPAGREAYTESRPSLADASFGLSKGDNGSRLKGGPRTALGHRDAESVRLRSQAAVSSRVVGYPWAYVTINIPRPRTNPRSAEVRALSRCDNARELSTPSLWQYFLP